MSNNQIYDEQPILHEIAKAKSKFKRTAAFFRMQSGLYITNVISGGAADLAGVKSGDYIVSIDGEKITTSAELKQLAAAHSPGDTVRLVVIRNNTEINISLIMSEEA